MSSPTDTAPVSSAGLKIRSVGVLVMTFGLAVIFLWFGGMKFTSYEAGGIAPFIMNSPLVSWWHALLGVQGASDMLGVFEIATGLLLLARPILPRAAIVGGAMATLTFIITLSFFITTPGVAAPQAGGFPAISADVGQFLLKDLGLLGISIWLLGDALAAARRASLRHVPTSPAVAG
jgi:reactive chlorine resistance protein C